MKNKDFRQLLDSVHEAGTIKRGKLPPSRRFEFEPVDVKSIRKKLNLTQQQFALMIGISLGTLRNWEQGRRYPDGPARALLQVAARNPEAVRDALMT